MANNTNLPRNADIAAGGKLIKELIPKSMASIMQIAYVAIIPAPPPPSAASGVVQAAECDWNHQKVH